jgi:hypothetical protein
MKIFLKVLKFLFKFSQLMILGLGVLLLMMVLIAGINEEPLSIIIGNHYANGNLTTLVQGNVFYIFLAVLFIFFVGLTATIINSIIRIFRVKGDKRPVQKRLLTWFLEN